MASQKELPAFPRSRRRMTGTSLGRFRKWRWCTDRESVRTAIRGRDKVE